MYQLANLESLYSESKFYLENYGTSAQYEDRYPLHTDVNQRREQTLNRDAKTSGDNKF